MSSFDYDDPVVDEQWCDARRQQVIKYLEREHVNHGQVGEHPAWHIAPYVSVWAVESKINPGWVGWWVICGDLPTDYVSAASLKHPRKALEAVGQRWQEVSSHMERGEPHPTMSIGSSEDWPKLAPLLSSRAKMLLEWASDDARWDE